MGSKGKREENDLGGLGEIVYQKNQMAEWVLRALELLI